MTRPGIAAIASALLVEIFISILQHPHGALAPSPKSQDDDRGSHPLGIVPHQIRGYLSNFQNMLVSGKSYDCCSACSDRVTSAYRAEGWQFVKKALNEKGYVEDLSGLASVSPHTHFLGESYDSSFLFSKYMCGKTLTLKETNRFSVMQKRHYRRWNGVTMMVTAKMKAMGNSYDPKPFSLSKSVSGAKSQLNPCGIPAWISTTPFAVMIIGKFRMCCLMGR